MTIYHRPLVCILALALVAVTACKPRSTRTPDTPEALAAKIAEMRAHLAKHPDDWDTWRDLGHLHWLHADQVDEAVPIFDKLAARGDNVARLSRAVIAESRLDHATVAAQAAAVLRDAASSDDSITADLSEPASRLLASIGTSVAAGDKGIVALTDEIDETRLPPESAQQLLSLRAGIERRHGRDYQPYYAAQGCVQSWQVGAAEGHLGVLDLGRLAASKPTFVADPNAVVANLACTVRVHNPVPAAVVRRMQTVLDVGTDAFVLELAAQEPMRAYLDGELVIATDRTDHAPARHYWFDVTTTPGPHVLEVHVAIPDTRSWVLTRAIDAYGQPIAARTGTAQPTGSVEIKRRVGELSTTEPLASDLYDPLRAYLALEDAIADGDDYRAESIVRRANKWNFAAGQLLLARFHEADGSRAPSMRTSQAQQAYEAALASDAQADRARLAVLDVQLARGEGEAVVEALKKLPDDRLDSVEGDLLRARVYLERGSEFLAQQALQRASERSPKACEVIMARRTLAARRNQVEIVDQLTGQLRRCSGTLGLRARWAIDRNDLAMAERLWKAKVSRAPDDVEAMEELANVAVAKRDFEEASRLHERVLSVAPYRLGSHVEQADLLAHAGDYVKARQELGKALARLPHISRLREIGRTLDLDDDLWAYRMDAGPVVDEYRQANVDYGGAGEVLVLDRDVARVYENGGQRHVVHQVVHLLSKNALDEYGELVPPDDATVLALHSIKPDGTVLEPELVPGKDGLSLRHLEIGDLVEYEYLIDVDPIPALPGYVDLSRFRFQSLDVPYHRSELIVLHPADLPVQVENRNGAPEPQISERDGIRMLTFRADRMKRRGAEPNHRSLIDELPMVRVHTPLDIHGWLDLLSSRLYPAQRANPELEALARKLTRKRKDDRAKLRALWDWVMENIEEDGDLSTPATRTLAQRRGDRLMLLRSMLNAIDVRSEVWLVRDKYGARLNKGGHPMPEVYDQPSLAVWPRGAKEPVMVMTLSRNMPLGYLAPAHASSDALRVWLADGDAPSGPVRTPASPPSLADRRTYDLEITVDERGQGNVQGTITLHGLEAIQWRQILEEVDADRIAEVFQQSELGSLIPGAALDLDEVHMDHVEDTASPLVITFTAQATGVGVHQGGELVIPAMLVPMNQGLSYTRLPTRWSGLVIQYAPELEAKVSVELVGSRFVAMPPPETIKTTYGTYERKIEAGGTGQERVVVWTHATLNEGIVEAPMYAELAAFTRGVAAAEKAVLRAK